MPDPSVTLYVTHVDPQDVVMALSEIGLSARWPLHPDVVSVLDLEGDTVATSPTEFRELLRSPAQDSVTFQLWFSGSEDVVVTVFRNPEKTGPLAALRITAYLDGAPRSQAAAVAAALERFVVQRPSATVALIADLRGSAEEVDWVHVLVDSRDLPVVDLLILDARLVSDEHGHTSEDWLAGAPVEGLVTRRR